MFLKVRRRVMMHEALKSLTITAGKALKEDDQTFNLELTCN